MRLGLKHQSGKEVQNQVLSRLQCSTGTAVSVERKSEHGAEENFVQMRGILANGDTCGSHLSVGDLCSAFQRSWHSDICRTLVGGVSPPHFQDFCENVKGCWTELMR